MPSSPVPLRLCLLLMLGMLPFAACGGSNGETYPSASTPPPAASPSPAATEDPTCTGTPPAALPDSALQNGGFESGRDPWTSLSNADWGTPFEVTQDRPHTGVNSAFLKLRSEDGGATKVYGVVQEVSPAQFPEVLSGYYYVRDWQQGTPKQYLQAVVIVNGAANMPQAARDLKVNNHQMRYILAGVDVQPTDIANARYVMVTKEPPKVGEWVHFERDVRQDFCELWGNVPVGFTSIRVFFETRWDERKDTDGPSSADVYYDDLYWGPAAGVP